MFHFLFKLSDSLRHLARRRRLDPGLASGFRAEDLAQRFVQQRGYTVVARNYRPRSGHGEIDLIAWDRGTLVIIEVKSRRTEEFGAPDRAVDQEKRETLIRTAQEYARRAGVPWEQVRFDIVNVILTDPPFVSHSKDAFPAYPDRGEEYSRRRARSL
jgi:putative endonuclease